MGGRKERRKDGMKGGREEGRKEGKCMIVVVFQTNRFNDKFVEH